MLPNGQQNLSSEKSSFKHIRRSTQKTWSLPLAEPTKHTNGRGDQSVVPLPPLRLLPGCTRRPLDCTNWPPNIATVTWQHIVTPPVRHREAAQQNRADAERKRQEAENE